MMPTALHLPPPRDELSVTVAALEQWDNVVAWDSETEPRRNSARDSEASWWGRFSATAVWRNDALIRGRPARRACPTGGVVEFHRNGRIATVASRKTVPATAVGLFALIASVVSLQAQPVMAPALQDLAAIAASSGAKSPSQLSMPSAARKVLAAAKAPANPPPFQWGSLELRPHMDYRWRYGSGLQSRPGSQANTSIQDVSLGFSAQVVEGLSIDYTATQSIYSDPQFSDSLNHSFSLNGGKEKQF
jgi:hypothetical protein